jgi:hypothetical protein
MPIQKVFLKMRVDAMPNFVNEEGEYLPDQFSPLMLDSGLYGPLWLRTGDIDPRVSEETQVKTRLAMNDLLDVIFEHEAEEHDGEFCDDERIGMLAFFMHSLGVSRESLPRIMDALSIYEEHHEHDGHEEL